MVALLRAWAFGVGLLLGFAALCLWRRKRAGPFYYVTRQAFFGVLAIAVMIGVSMMPPNQIRRFGTVGFALGFVAIVLLPFFGTDFGKGAVRWFSLGFASVQPSEFLKPGFVVFGMVDGLLL